MKLSPPLNIHSCVQVKTPFPQQLPFTALECPICFFETAFSPAELSAEYERRRFLGNAVRWGGVELHKEAFLGIKLWSVSLV